MTNICSHRKSLVSGLLFRLRVDPNMTPDRHGNAFQIPLGTNGAGMAAGGQAIRKGKLPWKLCKEVASTNTGLRP